MMKHVTIGLTTVATALLIMGGAFTRSAQLAKLKKTSPSSALECKR